MVQVLPLSWGMNVKNLRPIPFKCPLIEEEVPLTNSQEFARSPKVHHVVRKGFYRRKSDSKRVPRYFCRDCRRSFSSAFFFPCYRQKKRKLNDPIGKLYSSCVSIRRIARLLRTTQQTVARKIEFLELHAKLEHQEYIKSIKESGRKVTEIQFDEMETFERSKCLPLSIPLVIEAETRKILGFRVCSMPAKGPLAAVSLRKYGPRADDRAESASSLFAELAPIIDPNAKITSDQNPKYPAWIKRHFPNIQHETVKGHRGCVVGQGELKKIGFDPLFDFNHTAAMLRANINRLVRRTWCTTKRLDRLIAHIWIYVQFHNQYLTKSQYQ
jgi:transposase-like protein